MLDDKHPTNLITIKTFDIYIYIYIYIYIALFNQNQRL